jgi:asparagine synthase (glutamine-hydrolysing)
MCGIAGIIRFNKSIVNGEIERMTSTMTHRGPDGQGVWKVDNAALGHRRLAIIDVQGGKQPMCNEDQTIWISYNGEIYNFKELRDRLIRNGHEFVTKSDTEVVIHAYEEWGQDCVKEFRGMFAFAIADLRKRCFFIARDHLGIKPLVYYIDENCFACASEILALKVLDDLSFDIDVRSMDLYLSLQYIPAPLTIFKKIRKLPPAHCMCITFDGRVGKPESYWDLAFVPDSRKNKNEWAEELENLLRDSVKAHLISDVPFGAFLSGGIDSSTVLAYMSQILGNQVDTFSIGFEEEDYNELKYADIVAKRWGTKHHFEIVKIDALGILPELAKHYGEPFGDSSAIPTYYVSKLARQHVTMALSGDGGDEAFAGYNTYARWQHFLSNAQPKRSFVRKSLRYAAEKIMPFDFPPRLTQEPSLDNWLNFVNYIPRHIRTKLWRNEYRENLSDDYEEYTSHFRNTVSYSNVNKVQYMDIKTYLPSDILTKVDIASMMHGLEVRTPFVDVKVMEFAATIPEELNTFGEMSKVYLGKFLLKSILNKYYPDDFLFRQKTGFGLPINKWIENSSHFREYTHDSLTGTGSQLHEYFKIKTIETIIQKKMISAIWVLVFLNEWLSQNASNFSTYKA